MTERETRQDGSFSSSVRRGFWGLMILGHLPALVGSWRVWVEAGLGMDRLSSCLLLGLSILFFVLKFQDVSFLRLPCRRQSWIAIFTIVAMIHVDCLPSQTPQSLISEPVAVLSVVSVMGVLSLRPKGLHLPLRGSLSSSASPVSMGMPGGDAWMDAFRPRCWVLAAHIYALRAPPA